MGVEIIHGDCLDVLRGLPDASVDAVVTDPPFKLSQAYSSNVDADNLLAVAGFWGSARELCRVSKPGALAAIFYDTRILPLALAAMRDAGWQYLRGLTLYRRWGSASMLYGWMSTSDFILLFAKPGARYHFHGDARHDVYTRTGPEEYDAGTPAQKPLATVRHLVGRITPPDGSVLDCYAGSGTTGVAALMEGRSAILIEREAAYVEIARKRVAEVGQQPRLFAQAAD